jgi:uncharacterized protein YjbJ (UPF0337 family)/SAM-dependent methyltransferase
MSGGKKRNHTSSRSWDAVAEWYAGWVGAHGSEHHRDVAIPAVMDLLAPTAGERVLDVGCGTAALAAHVARAGARYTGIDASERLVSFARRHNGSYGRFILGDVTRRDVRQTLATDPFDAVVFLLSVQDIDPLHAATRLIADGVRPGGRVVLLMTHPCFRVPRQSGWGWDAGRRLRFRRVDHYLSPLAVPMKTYADGRGATRSYHRPVEQYVDALTGAGLYIDRLREIPYTARVTRRGRAELRADREIPLFLALRAVRPLQERVHVLPTWKDNKDLQPGGNMAERKVDDRTTSEKGADNKVRGKGNELKGRVKDAVGGLTNDSSLQAEGKFDKLKGKVQDKVGDVQRRVGRETDEPRR